jgi:hypothetical protein
MSTDDKKVVDAFPHPTIAPIVIRVPTYESINALNLQLNANAASVQSNLRDGLLGLLYLTITPAEYNALSATELLPPENPGAAPTVPYTATDSQVATLLREHKANTNLFKEYIVLLNWSNPVSQVLRAIAVKRTTRGRYNFGELMTVKIS